MSCERFKVVSRGGEGSRDLSRSQRFLSYCFNAEATGVELPSGDRDFLASLLLLGLEEDDPCRERGLCAVSLPLLLALDFAVICRLENWPFCCSWSRCVSE